MKSMAIFLSNVCDDFGRIYSNLAGREDLKVSNLEILTVDNSENKALLEQIFSARGLDRWTVSTMVRSMDSREKNQVMFVEIEWKAGDYFADKYEEYSLRKRAKNLSLDLIPVCGKSINLVNWSNICLISEDAREYRIYAQAENMVIGQRMRG